VGDLLVVAHNASWNAGNSIEAISSGWTLANRWDIGVSSGLRSTLVWKIATGSDALAFTYTGASPATAGSSITYRIANASSMLYRRQSSGNFGTANMDLVSFDPEAGTDERPYLWIMTRSIAGSTFATVRSTGYHSLVTVQQSTTHGHESVRRVRLADTEDPTAWTHGALQSTFWHIAAIPRAVTSSAQVNLRMIVAPIVARARTAAVTIVQNGSSITNALVARARLPAVTRLVSGVTRSVTAIRARARITSGVLARYVVSAAAVRARARISAAVRLAGAVTRAVTSIRARARIAAATRFPIVQRAATAIRARARVTSGVLARYVVSTSSIRARARLAAAVRIVGAVTRSVPSLRARARIVSAVVSAFVAKAATSIRSLVRMPTAIGRSVVVRIVESIVSRSRLGIVGNLAVPVYRATAAIVARAIISSRIDVKPWENAVRIFTDIRRVVEVAADMLRALSLYSDIRRSVSVDAGV
jgi:hypothetical protein